MKILHRNKKGCGATGIPSHSIRTAQQCKTGLMSNQRADRASGLEQPVAAWPLPWLDIRPSAPQGSERH